MSTSNANKMNLAALKHPGTAQSLNFHQSPKVSPRVHRANIGKQQMDRNGQNQRQILEEDSIYRTSTMLVMEPGATERSDLLDGDSLYRSTEYNPVVAAETENHHMYSINN